MRVSKERAKIFFLIVIFLTIFLAIYFAFELKPKDYLQVSFLDVGQGDAILFQTPMGGKILVDGGRDKKVLQRLGEELPVFSRNIELVIATHDDSDHIAGLIDVLKRYNVKVLLYSLPASGSLLSQELIKVAKKKNVRVVQAEKPMTIHTDDGLQIKILFPVKNMDGAQSNEASIAAQFVFGQNKFLLTGDLPQVGEIFLVKEYGENLQSDVLKLGHHGSDTSTNPEFLQKVSPQVAVVSTGKNNSFGHPHQSVLDLLEKFGIHVYRTDDNGTIDFYSNGVNIWKK